MDDLIDQLTNSSWYCAIDLKSAYFQIPLEEESRPKTAFATSQGLFEYTVMPQGLRNSPATFSRFMDTILRSVKSFTIVYLDDILCHASSKEECIKHVTEVLRILHHWNLKISLKKCKFLVREVPFVGFVISGTGVRSNPEKVAPIQNWPKPSNLKEMQQFLGICTFYHKYIAHLSAIAYPLYQLTKKDAEWNWTSDCQVAFDTLKKKLIELPELAYPDSNLPYELHCDASNYALGAVLVQSGRPVAYASRTLIPAEKNYTTTEKECLAVAWSLKYFHCYVHGASLIVYTDHAALKSILAIKDPKGRIARWITDIWTYEFALIHRKGVENLDADALSRIRSNAQTEHLEEENFKLTQTDLEVAQANDEYIIKIKEQQPMQQKFFMKHNILCYNNGDNPVVVIPSSLQSQFLKNIHDHPTSGHLGRDKMIHKAKENGWWPSMNKDVTEYVKQCMKCKMHKTPTHKYRKLTSIEVGAPGEMWAADIAFLPLSTRNNRYLLVCMDYLTKWVVTAALPSLDADSVANVLLYSVILVFGHVSKFLTDNGTNFIAEALQMICKRLGIKKIQTSVEHPQTDGLVERMNRTIKSALAIYCEENSKDWDVYLPFVTFAINTSKQASTGETPFKPMFGRKAQLPSLQEIADLKITTYTTKAWLAHLNHYIPILHNNIRANIQRSQKTQQHYYNKGRKEKVFQVDDIVLKIKMKDTWKFPEPKFTGPWKIVEVTGKNNDAFKLELVQENRTKRQYKKKKTTTANIKDLYQA